MTATYHAVLTRDNIPDTDSSPHDYLPRDYQGERDEHGNPYPADEVAKWEAADANVIATWERDDWHYWGVCLTATVSTVLDSKTFTTQEGNSLWGVDDIDPTYPDTVAAELKEELISQLMSDYPGISIEDKT